MRVLVACALVLAACDVPSPALRFRLADGDVQSCGTAKCGEIGVACEMWMNVRIVDPEAPASPYLSQCQPVPRNSRRDLCAIARVDLEPVPVPVRNLEVQVALYPADMIQFDAETNEPLCPTDVRYDAVNGFPVSSVGETPAIGGRAFYRPGDEEVIVTLGCTNLELLNAETCTGTSNVRVTATVDDFDTHTSVVPFEANRLSVAVGDPKFESGVYVLNPGDLEELDQRATFPPAWGGDLDTQLDGYACLAVLDATPQSTSTVTCQQASITKSNYEFTGVRIVKATLDQIITALGTPFPAQGITVGLVLDRNGNPLAGQAVNAPGATVRYLSSDRSSIAGTTTSASGVFVSTDAMFGTVFSTTSGVPPQTRTGIGGRIEGKVTVVVLRFAEPVVGGGG